MYCSQCGKEIPENSKFCNDCSSPVVEKKAPQVDITNKLLTDIHSNSNNTEQEKSTSKIEENAHTNSDDENIPMPKISACIGLGIASVFALITVIITIQLSFIVFILDALLFVIMLGAWISSIKDYTLAKNDFAQYQKKVREGRKAAKAMQDEINAKQEADRKKQAELNKKRAEYRAKGIPICPKCGSPSIATINRGYSMVSGFIGSGKPINVCQICGHKWQIGK